MRVPSVCAESPSVSRSNPKMCIQCHDTVMRLLAILLLLSLANGAFAIDARNSPADYPAPGEVQDFRLGVDYLVRSFLADGQSFSIDDYLIIEVGIFPQGEAKVDYRRFNLRINGKRTLAAQSAGMVAASIKYPDWRSKPTLVGTVGMPGGRDVVVARPPAVPRFPGDERRTQGPDIGERSKTEAERPSIDYDQLVKRSALPEGKFNKPVAGFLYFPYDGKLKSIGAVDLLIDDQVLKLR